jgi:erythromycin esterase
MKSTHPRTTTLKKNKMRGTLHRSSATAYGEMVEVLRRNSIVVKDSHDLQPLLDRIGDARIVMLGEASHGTHEFYTWRSRITQTLIREKGFRFIAVEGDWPDAYRLNRYVKHYADAGASAREVLQANERWPTWMWANWEVVALAEWMRKWNGDLPQDRSVGFYGLDVYSLWESLHSIMAYLRKVDPQALKVAERAWSCFEPYREEEGSSYARALQIVPELCRSEVIDLLSEIRRKLPSYNTDHEHVFSAEQNALVALHAEDYYRAMLLGGPHSWNVRDRHMMETLQRLLDHHGTAAKAIVWAHNTHVGDARATDMALEGMFNIGELARQAFAPGEVALVGFGTYQGSVVAGGSWGSDERVLELPPGRHGSWEDLMHQAGGEDRLLFPPDLPGDLFLEHALGHRAIGVVYHPSREQYGNYVPSILPLRYDAFLHLDHTKALHSLKARSDPHQMPETYPFGI